MTKAAKQRTKVTTDGKLLTVHAPMMFRIHRHGKKIVPPINSAPWKRESRFDSTLIKALVRAFRWRDLLESGAYSTIRELAKAEQINESYICRVLRLSLLSPIIVDQILNGIQPAALHLKALMRPFPFEWQKQVRAESAI